MFQNIKADHQAINRLTSVFSYARTMAQEFSCIMAVAFTHQGFRISAMPVYAFEDIRLVTYVSADISEDALMSLAVRTAFQLSEELTKEEISVAESGDRMGAIKMIRARTGLGLKDAKDLMEDRVPPPKKDGERAQMLPVIRPLNS